MSLPKNIEIAVLRWMEGESFSQLAKRYKVSRNKVAKEVGKFGIDPELVRKSNEAIPRWRYHCVRQLTMSGLRRQAVLDTLDINARQLYTIEQSMKSPRDVEEHKKLHEEGKKIYWALSKKVHEATYDKRNLPDPCWGYRDPTYRRT